MESLFSGKWRLKHNNLVVAGVWVFSASLFACTAGKQQNIQKLASEKVNETVSYVTNYSASGKPYYHLSYELNSENLLQLEQYTSQEFEQNGAQFEVILEKSTFPIKAPNCKSNLILRMPWVPPNTDLSSKYHLYQAILAVHMRKVDSVSIVLELNPYVRKTEQGIELTQCNIFFRHANSGYVTHTKSLN